MDPHLAAYLEAVQKAAATQDLTQDLGRHTLEISGVFLALAAFFVALRLLSRYLQGQHYSWDDGLLIASLVFLGAQVGIVAALVRNGLGKHSGALNLDQAMTMGKILLIAYPVYICSITLIKLSILLMYMRLFPVRSMKWAAYILGAISMGWWIALIVTSQAQCRPYRKVWMPWVPGYCANLKAIYLAMSIPNILTDVAILSLPLPHVWGLNADIRQKLYLVGMFLLGGFVVFTSVYRFVMYIRFDKSDLSYTLAIPAAWNNVEVGSGIISACLPTLRPLIMRITRSIRGYLGTGKNEGKSSVSRTGESSTHTIGGSGPKGNKARRWNELDSFAKYGGRITTIIENSKARQSDENGDEVPLRHIVQKSDVTVTEELYLPATKDEKATSGKRSPSHNYPI